MGLLTDFVIAKKAEAASLAESTNPTEDFEGVEAKGLDPVKLESLWALLARGGKRTGKFKMVKTASDEGPWVLDVPAEFTRFLASLAEKDATGVVKAWAATEEMEADGWKTEDARRALDLLVAVARKATKKKSGLLMWMSM